MTHPELGSAQHQIGILEPRTILTVEIDHRRHDAVRTDLDVAQVVNIEPRVARLAWAHKQCDVLSPRHKRPLEESKGLTAAFEQCRVLLRLRRAKLGPFVHIDPSDQKRGIHRVMDIVLLDILLSLLARSGEDVAISSTVDDNVGIDRLPTLFGFEHHPANRTVFHNRHARPRMQNQAYAALETHFLAQELEPLRIDSRRPGHGAMEHRSAQ